jgi:hypothetical protein
MSQKRFFSPCSKYIGIETEDEYHIFRTSEGTIMCHLKKKNIDLVTDNKGACSIIVGLIDIPGRKFYPWSIWSLIHISKSRLILFEQD